MERDERIERNTRAFGLDYNGALNMISENAEKAVSELIEVYDWESVAKVARISMDDTEKVFGCQNDEREEVEQRGTQE